MWHRDERHAGGIENSESFQSKIKIIGNKKDVEIAVPLKLLSNFWRTPEMPLINCGTNIILTWSSIGITTISTGAGILTVTDTKLYFAVVTVSPEDNAKLL